LLKTVSILITLGLTFLTASSTIGGDDMSFSISSPDFREGDSIPQRFTCDGEDLSPQLFWDNAPEGTKSFVLTVEDPDAPMGTFTHWVVYDVPSTTQELKRGAGSGKSVLNGMKQGRTDFGHSHYGGPCPPKSYGKHRYYFILRALDVPAIGIPPEAKKNIVDKAMKGHVLAETRLMGTYER
jgi:Raf kinase inhibitor-like YbhB/YbcL family protein